MADISGGLYGGLAPLRQVIDDLRNLKATCRRFKAGQSPEAMRDALEFFGAEHVLLGSDTPFISPAQHLTSVQNLQLSPADFELVVCKNALRTLGLQVTVG